MIANFNRNQHGDRKCPSTKCRASLQKGMDITRGFPDDSDGKEEETWVQCLGREDPLEEEMATHSSVLAWRIPWTEEPGGLQSMGLHKVGQA